MGEVRWRGGCLPSLLLPARGFDASSGGAARRSIPAHRCTAFDRPVWCRASGRKREKESVASPHELWSRVGKSANRLLDFRANLSARCPSLFSGQTGVHGPESLWRSQSGPLPPTANKSQPRMTEITTPGMRRISTSGRRRAGLTVGTPICSIVMGAGISGMAAAIQLKRQFGLQDVLV